MLDGRVAPDQVLVTQAVSRLSSGVYHGDTALSVATLTADEMSIVKKVMAGCLSFFQLLGFQCAQS